VLLGLHVHTSTGDDNEESNQRTQREGKGNADAHKPCNSSHLGDYNDNELSLLGSLDRWREVPKWYL
jgi:hypothetical protein